MNTSDFLGTHIPVSPIKEINNADSSDEYYEYGSPHHSSENTIFRSLCSIPDQAVYQGRSICYVKNRYSLLKYSQTHGVEPKICFYKSGVYITSHSMNLCNNIKATCQAAKIMYCNANSFGGIIELDQEEIIELETCDVQQQRKKQAL